MKIGCGGKHIFFMNFFFIGGGKYMTTDAKSVIFSGKRVTVLLRDSRQLQGVLLSCDSFCNVVLSDCVEVRYSALNPPTRFPLGTFVVKGASVVLVGLVDNVSESECDFTSLRSLN